MAFLKRIEVWMLLILGGGLAVWVLSGGDSQRDLPPEWTVEGGADEGPVLTLRGGTVERDYGNARLDLRVMVRNTTIRPLLLRPPVVKLVTDSGVEVAPFFLPAELPPEVAAGRSSEVTLRYWLEEAEVEEALRLVVNDATVAVKSAGSVPLGALPNGEPVEIQTLDWTTLVAPKRER